jgi:hypothetical protein
MQLVGQRSTHRLQRMQRSSSMIIAMPRGHDWKRSTSGSSPPTSALSTM